MFTASGGRLLRKLCGMSLNHGTEPLACAGSACTGLCGASTDFSSFGGSGFDKAGTFCEPEGVVLSTPGTVPAGVVGTTATLATPLAGFLLAPVSAGGVDFSEGESATGNPGSRRLNNSATIDTISTASAISTATAKPVRRGAAACEALRKIRSRPRLR